MLIPHGWFEWFSLGPGHSFITEAKEGATLPRIPNQSHQKEGLMLGRQLINTHTVCGHLQNWAKSLSALLLLVLGMWELKPSTPTQLSTEHTLRQLDCNYSTVFINTTLLFWRVLPREIKVVNNIIAYYREFSRPSNSSLVSKDKFMPPNSLNFGLTILTLLVSQSSPKLSPHDLYRILTKLPRSVAGKQ